MRATSRSPLWVFVDAELGDEAFTYIMESGAYGTIHLEQVLEYNEDPTYLRDQLLYKLTIEAQKRVTASKLSKRENHPAIGNVGKPVLPG